MQIRIEMLIDGPRHESAAAGQQISLSKYRHSIDLMSVLVSKDLKVRYRSTMLGYVWSLLYPLAFALIFYFLFRVIVRIEVENYALFLIGGLFPWHWISNSASGPTLPPSLYPSLESVWLRGASAVAIAPTKAATSCPAEPRPPRQPTVQ